MKKEKTSLLRNGAVQSLLASLLCILLGLLIGYIALLLINPSGAGEAILTIVKNFMTYSRSTAQLQVPGQHPGQDRTPADVQFIGPFCL